MGKRIIWVLCLGLCFGCTVLPRQAPQPAPPEATVGPLDLAAQCLERGDDAAAAPHLARYVDLHPEHVTIRVHYAELLLRLKNPGDARRQFEQFVVDAPRQGEPACKQLIHAHTRLVEIAQSENDAYQEHLHRGIGLLLLARQVAGQPDVQDAPDPEKMLFKAATELKQAAEARPGAAQPHWYGYAVWSQLGQQLPARKCLRQARDAGPLSDLNPSERQELTLACSEQFGRGW